MSNKPQIDDAAILAKANRGEALSEEEEFHVASALPGQTAPVAAESKEKEAPEEVEETTDDETGSEETPDPAEEKSGEEASEEPEQEPSEEVEDPKTKNRKELIEAELEKPESQRDLSKFSNAEIGIYIQLKRQRQKNQRLAEENSILKFKDMQTRLKEDETKKETEEPDPLDGREDDDLLTVADVKKLLKKKPVEEKKPQQTAPLVTQNDIRVAQVLANDRLRAKGVTDFYDVIDFAQEALSDDLEAADHLRRVVETGGNVAEETYWLIKGSKKWPELEKKLVKPKPKTEVSEVNAARAKKLEENGKKIKTTGAATGSASGAGEFTVEQIKGMSPQEFGRLPKKTQEQILWKFGSSPNL